MASGDFTAEDIHACEKAQANLKSPYFEVGPAAKGESPVLEHQLVVLDFLDKPPLDLSPTSKAATGEGDSSTVTGTTRSAEITLSGQSHRLEVEPDQTILEAAKKADLDPPYSCQAGVCGACRAQLTEGTVEMQTCSALDEDEIASGAILTCQAKPTSPSVSVNYDSA